MKPSGEVIFGKKAIRGTWSARQERNEGAMRQGGAPTPLGRALVPRGLSMGPPDLFSTPTSPINIEAPKRNIDREFRCRKPL